MSGRRVVIRCVSSCDLSLLRLQKSIDFAAYEANEGAGQHLIGLPWGVFKVVVWVSQHVK